MEIENDKIYFAMNSLFRFTQMDQSSSMPDIVVDLERKILKERFDELSADEILSLFKLWDKFYQERVKENAIQDEVWKKDFDRELLEIN